MEKTLAELQADWVTHGHITARKTNLYGEADENLERPA